MALVTSRKSKLKPGEELTINYGDKGNEELLMQYGGAMSDCLKSLIPEQIPAVVSISGQEEGQVKVAFSRQAQLWSFLTDIRAGPSKLNHQVVRDTCGNGSASLRHKQSTERLPESCRWVAQRADARPVSAGFTLERNPRDTLMVVCPLPPAAEWDDGFHAKMKLLLAKGLSPQLFLTAAELKTTPGG